VAPMMGVVCLRGANFITEGVHKLVPKIQILYIQGLIVALAALFLYRNLNWQIDFNLHPSQLTQVEAQKKYGYKVSNEGYSLYSESMYVDMIFGLNPFDSPQFRSLHQILKREPIPEKSLLVWEPIFAGGMSKVPFEVINEDKRFQLIDSFQHADFIWGGQFKTYIFQTDTLFIHQLNANKPLFFNNFETISYPNTDSSRTKQGSRIIKIDQSKPYAPAMEGSISSYFTKSEHRFKISFDVYVEDITQVPSVVFQTLSTTGQSVNWKNYTINEQVKKANHWYSVAFFCTAQKTIETRDVFKIYAWNPNPAAAYIDNFKVDYAD
jgi:hypothetical protein